MLLEENKNTIFAVFLAIFFVVLIRTAWISDDAAITLRTVLNFTHGYGPTFNIDERVQAYTHPLWFFAISGLSLILKNVFTATFLLSIFTSLVVIWLLFTRVSTNLFAASISGCALILSKAYVDFSTSGLENPLSHLLIIFGVLATIRVIDNVGNRSAALFFTICSLIYLNRPDLLVLMLPLATLIVIKNSSKPKSLINSIVIGAIPVILWTAFSVYYYGFPFPNTAYAKLGTGIPLDDRFAQGFRYVLHGIEKDPITLIFILLGIAVGAFSSMTSRAISIGIALYFVYVLSIGGDFMEGRFFTAPLLAAAILVSRSDLNKFQLSAIGVGVLILGLININSTILSNSSYSNTKVGLNGIADERGFYYPNFGLLTSKRETFAQPKWKVGEREVAIICAGLGFNGIFKGPGMHYIDNCGLADPLLARLPAKNNPNWRIGHFIRQLPTDYQESIELNKNLIKDPRTNSYYESIRTITRSPLNSPERIIEILGMNLGKVEKPDWSMYQHQFISRSSKVDIVHADKLKAIVEGGDWNAAENIQFSSSIEVQLNQETAFDQIDISVDHNDTYKLEILSGANWMLVATIQPSQTAGMVRHQIELTERTPNTSKVRITAASGDEMYSVGHFIVR